MSSQLHSTNMSRILCDTLTVHNIVCDNIKVTKSGDGDFVAIFTFSDKCGLYGDVLRIVEEEEEVKGCIIESLLPVLYCHPLVIDGITVVKVPDTQCTRVSPYTVSEVYQSDAVFSARVNVTFKDISIRPSYLMGDGIYAVSYRSFKAIPLSTPCVWRHVRVTGYDFFYECR